MTHRFAIIGWGSLIWNPRTLPHDGNWRPHGPTLPIEFCRVARDGRLTLAIHKDHGVPVNTYFSASTRSSLADAVADLAEREQCDQDWIGSFALSADHRTASAMAAWCAASGFTGVVWTALESNFEQARNEPYSVAAALAYLAELDGDSRTRAHEYIQRAPQQTRTPLRAAFENSRADDAMLR